MRQDRPKTPAGNLKQATRQDVIDWVSRAWTSIEKDTLVHSFLVCGISNALDGTQDDLVSSDIPNVEDEDEQNEDAVTMDEEEDSNDVDGLGEPFSDEVMMSIKFDTLTVHNLLIMYILNEYFLSCPMCMWVVGRH